MQIDIGASIAALLYEHKSVSVPGFGTFITNYKPARVDQLEGKIHPPSKDVTFNKNLLLDDGLLVQHIRQKYNVTYPTALKAIEDFVKAANAAFEQRDIFTIPGVGRLYKDFEQNLTFLPEEDVNLNTGAYGLPTVQFYPVARGQRSEATPVSAKQTPLKSSKTRKQPSSGWLRRNVVAVSSVLLIATAVVVYWQFFYPNATAEEVEEPIDDTHYNVSPSRMTSDTGAEDILPTAPEEDDDAATDAATLRPEQQYVTIGVGRFGNSDNVERLVKRIYEAGYEPFTEPDGNLTRVGIQMTYETEQDIQEALKDIRKKFEPKAQVLERKSGRK